MPPGHLSSAGRSSFNRFDDTRGSRPGLRICPLLYGLTHPFRWLGRMVQVGVMGRTVRLQPSSFRQPGYLSLEARGFAPPPRGGLAFVVVSTLYHVKCIPLNMQPRNQ